MNEQWCNINGFPDYEVSNFGRVRRITVGGSDHQFPKGRMLKPSRKPNGYFAVNLYRDKAMVKKYIHIHSLVAQTFLGPRPKGMQINHLDCNKENNRLDNLEYCSHYENACHAVMHNRFPKGEAVTGSKLTELQVSTIRKLLKTRTLLYRLLAQRFSVSTETILHIDTGKNWKHVV